MNQRDFKYEISFFFSSSPSFLPPLLWIKRSLNDKNVQVMTITKADKQSWKLEFLLEEERNEDGSARNSFDKV